MKTGEVLPAFFGHRIGKPRNRSSSDACARQSSVGCETAPVCRFPELLRVRPDMRRETNPLDPLAYLLIAAAPS
jgi:hypothetical protein